MEKNYYVAYDINDEIIALLNNIFELCFYTGLRIYDVNYKFKGKDFILCNVNGKQLKIYRFI